MTIFKNKWFNLTELVIFGVVLLWMNIDLCKLTSVHIAYNVAIIFMSISSFLTGVESCLDKFIEDKDSN